MPSITKSIKRQTASRKARYAGRMSGPKFLQQTAMARGDIRAIAKAVLDQPVTGRCPHGSTNPLHCRHLPLALTVGQR